MKLDVLQRNALIAQYMPLARSLAAKKHSQVNWIDIDELRSAAYYGLVDAASRYDTEHGGFFRYAMVRISGEVQDYLRSLGFGSKGSNSRGCSRLESLDVGDNECAFLQDKSEGNLRVAFEEMTEHLPARGRKLLWDYFVEGRKMKEIGLELGIGEARVSQLISSYHQVLAA
jgi:RNA polymerase sigma factor for flagellar operon FliA